MIELQLLQVRYHLREYPSVIYTTYCQTNSIRSNKDQKQSSPTQMLHAWNLDIYPHSCSCFWTLISSKVHHTTWVPWNAMFSNILPLSEVVSRNWSINLWSTSHHWINHVRHLHPPTTHTWYPLKKSTNQIDIYRVQQLGKQRIQQVQYSCLHVFAFYICIAPLASNLHIYIYTYTYTKYISCPKSSGASKFLKLKLIEELKKQTVLLPQGLIHHPSILP